MPFFSSSPAASPPEKNAIGTSIFVTYDGRRPQRERAAGICRRENAGFRLPPLRGGLFRTCAGAQPLVPEEIDTPSMICFWKITKMMKIGRTDISVAAISRFHWLVYRPLKKERPSEMVYFSLSYK